MGHHEYVGLVHDKLNEPLRFMVRFIRELGFRPVLLTDVCRKALHEHFYSKEDIDDLAIVVPKLNVPGIAVPSILEELKRRSINLEHCINVRDPLSDTFLILMDRLGITFPFLEAYRTCRVKPIARTMLHKKNLTRGQFAVHSITNPERPTSMSLPLVSKPITGSGSHGVALVETENDWLLSLQAAHARRGPDDFSIAGFRPRSQVLLESRYYGTEYEIDGYRFQGATTICALGFKHHNFSEIGVREMGGQTYYPGNIPAYESADLRLVKWVHEILDALNYETGVFHVEAMAKGDHIELIEVNPRFGGGGVTEIVHQLSGVDLIAECVRLWLGLKPDRVPAVSGTKSVFYLVQYPSLVGYLRTIRKEGMYPFPFRQGQSVTARWLPLVTEGLQLDYKDREQYLGELHIANVPLAVEELEHVVMSLQDLLRELSFVEEVRRDPDLKKSS